LGNGRVANSTPAIHPSFLEKHILPTCRGDLHQSDMVHESGNFGYAVRYRFELSIQFADDRGNAWDIELFL
jgi:hypothetical protein